MNKVKLIDKPIAEQKRVIIKRINKLLNKFGKDGFELNPEHITKVVDIVNQITKFNIDIKKENKKEV